MYDMRFTIYERHDTDHCENSKVVVRAMVLRVIDPRSGDEHAGEPPALRPASCLLKVTSVRVGG